MSCLIKESMLIVVLIVKFIKFQCFFRICDTSTIKFLNYMCFHFFIFHKWNIIKLQSFPVFVILPKPISKQLQISLKRIMVYILLQKVISLILLSIIIDSRKQIRCINLIILHIVNLLLLQLPNNIIDLAFIKLLLI